MHNLNHTTHGEGRGGRAITPHTLHLKHIAESFTGLPEGVSKYDLLDLVKKVGRERGFTPRLVTHLEYLLRYTRDQDWLPGARPIVYVSVTTMAQDQGVTERQIYNLERKLNELGALTWQDYGNHRRHGHRDGSGCLVFGYGVDLSPLTALYDDLYSCARRLQARKEAWRIARQRISQCRKECLRLLNAVIALPGEQEKAEAYHHLFNIMDQRITSSCTVEDLYSRHASMKGLQLDLQRLFSRHYDHGAGEDACGKHLETSDPAEENFFPYNTIQPQSSLNDESSNPHDEDKKMRRDHARQENAGFEPAPDGAGTGNKNQGKKSCEDVQIKQEKSWPSGIEYITLPQIYRIASETFRDMLPADNATSWQDISVAAASLCPHLGIHHSAWADACIALGRNAAAVCVLIADRRRADPDHPVRNPGGFLRACLRKAAIGELRLHQSVFGLLSKGGKLDT